MNRKDPSTIWIARLSGEGREPDNLNRYIVARGEEDMAPWTMQVVFNPNEHAQFTHRYGDGREVCVEKALEALRLFEES